MYHILNCNCGFCIDQKNLLKDAENLKSDWRKVLPSLFHRPKKSAPKPINYKRLRNSKNRKRKKRKLKQ